MEGSFAFSPGVDFTLPDLQGRLFSLSDFRMPHVRRLSEALEWLGWESCDVVLLDMDLPDSHGLDTLLLLWAQAQAVPRVVFTGFNDESLAADALQNGAPDYLVKGKFDSLLLLRSLSYAIA